MSGRQAILIVARREIVERVRERSFLIGTFVTIAIVAAVIVLPSLFGGGTEKVTVVTAGPQATRLAQAARATQRPFDVALTVRPVATDVVVLRRLESGDADAGVLRDGRTIVRRGGTSDAAVSALQAASARQRAIEALRSSGADPRDAQRILAPPPLRVRTVDQNAEDRKGFALVALIILYGQLITYGIWVAVGVVEEKSSRIVEILLATIRPRELLGGKVLGIGIVGIGQLLFIGALGLVIAAASGRVHVGGHELSALPVLLGWFVLGYALYACAFAVVGAIVPRQEDIQSVATPVVLTILASFFLSFGAVNEPDGTLARVLTFVPFSAPLVVPVRIIVGGVAAWQVALSVLIVLVTIVALVLLAARIYGNAVLQTGGKVGLLEALRPRGPARPERARS